MFPCVHEQCSVADSDNKTARTITATVAVTVTIPVTVTIRITIMNKISRVFVFSEGAKCWPISKFCVFVRACVRACVRTCVRACVRACVRSCVRAFVHSFVSGMVQQKDLKIGKI